MMKMTTFWLQLPTRVKDLEEVSESDLVKHMSIHHPQCEFLRQHIISWHGKGSGSMIECRMLIVENILPWSFSSVLTCVDSKCWFRTYLLFELDSYNHNKDEIINFHLMFVDIINHFHLWQHTKGCKSQSVYHHILIILWKYSDLLLHPLLQSAFMVSINMLFKRICGV